jgi:glycosyltransferase involved in cell wall biosynthesis
LTLVDAVKRVDCAATPMHLLFVGSGELGDKLRRSCDVVFDAEGGESRQGDSSEKRPRASFAGFLNQTQISRAYVAADCLVLPSDSGETWGLVVNEAMASGLPCIISDSCGCATDLGNLGANKVFPSGDQAAIADAIRKLQATKRDFERQVAALQEHSFSVTVDSVVRLHSLRTFTA